MKKDEVTLEEFKKLLEDHDWYYSFSDDERIFTKGLSQLNRIRKLCEGNDELAALYREKGEEIFGSPQSK